MAIALTRWSLPLHAGNLAATGGVLLRTAIFFVLAILLLAFREQAIAADPAKIVLIVTAEGEGVDDPTVIGNLQAGLRSQWPSRVHFYIEDVAPARFSNDVHQRDLRNYLRTKHSGRVDLVVALSQPALAFVLANRELLFAQVPILFAGAGETLERLEKEGITGIVVKSEPAQTVALAMELHSGSEQVVLITGTGRADQASAERVVRELAPLQDKITLTTLTDLPLEELIDRVKNLPPRTLILYLRVTRDASGSVFAPADALQLIRGAARLPIYGCSKSYIGSGLVGGVLVDHAAIGSRLGRFASRILAGEPAATLHPVVAENVTAFDARELRRFGIPERRLPAGALVEFRPLRWWQQVSFDAPAAAGLAAGISALAAGLMIQRRQRKRAERALAEQRRFQKNFADASTTFVTLAARGIDTAMRGALHRLLDFVGGDRAVIYQASDSPDTPWKVRFSEARPGLRPSIDNWDAQRVPWLIPRLRAGQVVTFFGDETRDQLAAAAPGSPPPVSAVAVPLVVGPAMLGVLWCIWFRAPRARLGLEIVVERFRLIGELFASAIRRSEIESRLTEAGQLNSAILSSLVLHVAVVDRTGTIIAVNDSWTAFGRQNGASESAIAPGANYLEVSKRGADEDAPLAREALEGIREVCEGQRDEFSHEYECSSSSEQHWYVMTVAALRRPEGGAVITHRDITESKRTEHAIRESELRFRLLADALPVGVWIADADGRRSYFNRAWLEFTGRGSDREIGDGWTDGLHPDDVRRYLTAYKRVLSAREPFSIEYRLHRKDGGYGWFVDAAVPRYGPDGSFHGLVGNSLDVTERKEAEDALRDLTGRVITAEEEDRRRIARDLHDGVNQLVALLAIEIEQLGLTPSGSQIDLSDRTRVLWKRTAEISSELHRLSHALHPSRLETFGLVAAIDGYCREITHQQHVRVLFSHEGIPPQLPPDTALCAFRIVQEALRNVVSHSGAQQAAVELSVRQDRLVLRVSDAGRGFDASEKKAGLGLVSMRERVRFAGGELTIASRPGEGTIIIVELPLARDSLAAPAARPV